MRSPTRPERDHEVLAAGPRLAQPGRLDVVYVNYNSSRLLLDSVDSLLTHDRAESLVDRIVVVDNASRAEDAAWLDRLPDAVHLIRADRNLGFAAAANRATRETRGEHLLFLNPDTRVRAETIPGIHRILQRHGGRALVGPRQYADTAGRLSIAPLIPTSLPGELMHVLSMRGWFAGTSLRFLRQRVDMYAREEPIPVHVLSGAALGVGRRTFEWLGGFDEQFFLYGEDVDLGLRARARGIPRLYLPRVGIVHWIEQSTGTNRVRAEQAMRTGREAVFTKHHHRVSRLIQRAACRIAVTLPRREDRWRRARPFDPTAALDVGEPPDAGRWAFELGRSPLFDNCITAFPEGASFTIPAGLLERIPPGTYFARIAAERRRGAWEERSLLRFTKQETAGDAFAPFRPEGSRYA
jgi:GT2 family glycosyltransferase